MGPAELLALGLGFSSRGWLSRDPPRLPNQSTVAVSLDSFPGTSVLSPRGLLLARLSWAPLIPHCHQASTMGFVFISAGLGRTSDLWYLLPSMNDQVPHPPPVRSDASAAFSKNLLPLTSGLSLLPSTEALGYQPPLSLWQGL